MKLTSVEIHPANSNEVAVLSFRDPGALNPFNVKGIDGLDADSIVPRFYRGIGTENFFNMSLEDREITFRIGLNPRFSQYESYSDLRDSLYRLIASSRTGKIDIWFKDSEVTEAVVSGVVSKIDAPLFEKTQEVQITIKCEDPTLRCPTPEIIIPYDDAITNAIFGIEDRKSTAPHGFYFEVKFTSHVGILTIQPEDHSWGFQLAPLGGFEIGDMLFFCSEANNKRVELVRPATATRSVADGIQPGSVWPIVFPGVNRFELSGTTGFQWQRFWHYPAYWGV